VSEILILPEMVEAGIEQVAECRKMKLDDEDTAIKVYLAMQGVFAILVMRGESERVH
jgi:hypothetical protein